MKRFVFLVVLIVLAVNLPLSAAPRVVAQTPL